MLRGKYSRRQILKGHFLEITKNYPQTENVSLQLYLSFDRRHSHWLKSKISNSTGRPKTV